MKRKLTKDWYTTGEVARWLGVTDRSVRNWIEEGRLAAYQIAGQARPGSYRIYRDDLYLFVTDNESSRMKWCNGSSVSSGCW